MHRYGFFACLLALSLVGPLGRSAAARPGQALVPPTLGAITLDGVADEAAWEQAARLPVAAVAVPHPGSQGTQPLAPDVRLGLSEGRLAIAVTMAEDPGASMGLHLMLAPEGTKSAADAISIDYRPCDPRAPRFRVIGPAGVGRTHYRVTAAADRRSLGRWSLECTLALADVLGAEPARGLRAAVVVHTRTPNVEAPWPAGALWSGPATWTELAVPEGGWPLAVVVDAERLAQEDAADERRQAAWLAYLKGSALPLLPVEPADKLWAQVERVLLAPLAVVVAERPDLTPVVDCIRGDIRHRLGDSAGAERFYDDALARAPGWREAGYGLYVKVRALAASAGTPGGPTDWQAFAARLDVLFDEGEHPGAARYARDGRRLATALLDYKGGRFAEAIAGFEPLVPRYPFDPLIEAHYRLSQRGMRAAAEELGRNNANAERALPRAVIETTAGEVVLELFDDDAPNTVANFVWLAKHGFYDDCAVHRTVPGFLAQTGDPFTRRASSRPALVGSGTPGYAIRTELGPVRGNVALANGGSDTDGSQFMLFTGSGVHLRGEITVFARVVAGLPIVDALVAGAEPDRIISVRFEGLDPERPYHPSTVAGRRAPEPAVPAVRGDPRDGAGKEPGK